jgi:predicted nucleic acid-binding protein
MVVFDTSVLAIAFDRNAAAPLDPSTGAPIADCSVRINYLLKNLEARKVRILIPTPVIAEFMVLGGPDREKRLDVMVNSKVFVVAPFDLRAAVECALIEEVDFHVKSPSNETKAKVKFDRQILATAIARGATTIYTGDKQLASRAKQCRLQAVLTWELELPPKPQESPQLDIQFLDSPPPSV